MARRRRKEPEFSIDSSLQMEASTQQEHIRLRKITLANYGNVLQNRHAREMVYEILSYAELYNVNAMNGEAALINAGSRKVGVEILSLLEEIDPTLYPKMILERGSDHGRGNRTDDRADDRADDSYGTDDSDDE